MSAKRREHEYCGAKPAREISDSPQAHESPPAHAAMRGNFDLRAKRDKRFAADYEIDDAAPRPPELTANRNRAK
jgi:hypothetical protein